MKRTVAIWRSVVFVVVGGLIALYFAYSIPTAVHANSYCGKTFGTEQGGITGNTITLTVNVQNGQRFSNPNITISGSITSVLGMSQWAVDSSGRCTTPPGAQYERATIGPVRIQLNGDSGRCGSGATCTRSSDNSHVSFLRSVTLSPGANTIHLQMHHAYERYFIDQGCNVGGVLCTLGTRSEPAIRDITVFYDLPPENPAPTTFSVQCGTDRNTLTWSALSAGSDRNTILRSVDGGLFASIQHTTPLTATSYTDPDVASGHSYKYVIQNCANGTLCRSNEVSCANSLAPGMITGICKWVDNRPQVVLSWSQSAQLPNIATTNVLEKGDAYPLDPTKYWGSLSNEPGIYQYTDATVELNTQYQYRIKYRPDLPSQNTYNVFVSAASCGGPIQPNQPVSISPAFQNVKPNVSAVLRATGGTGEYEWDAPGGVISGAGSEITVSFTNPDPTAITRYVTAHSGGQIAIANVQVDGVETLKDTIDLSAGGAGILINDGDELTDARSVTVRLTHGFAAVATSSITMRVADSEAALNTVAAQPFAQTVTWDLCGNNADCPEAPYRVYARFDTPTNDVTHGPTFDEISLQIAIPESIASVIIDGGAIQADDRTVTLSLWHGFEGIADGDVLVQLANRADLLADAYPFPYQSSAVWDLCAGPDPVCADGDHKVFARFINVRDGRYLDASDSIFYDSPWPDWGVRINNDAASADSSNVQLTLNPVFAAGGTQMSVSNRADFSDAMPIPYLGTFTWDLCDGIDAACGPGTALPHTVYMRFESLATGSWPGPRSPAYRDDILVSGIPTPLPGPAAVLINDGAASTMSRRVTLTLAEPFGGSGVTMRPVNVIALTERDREVIRDLHGGGLPGEEGARSPLWVSPQERVTQGYSTSPASGVNQGAGRSFPILTDTGLSVEELESVSERAFVPSIDEWDLCGNAAVCPLGEYAVFVQYYKRATLTGSLGSFAEVSDLISEIYFDTVQLGPTPTPTPTPTESPTPTPTATASPTTTAVPTGTVSPGPGASPSPTLAWPPTAWEMPG